LEGAESLGAWIVKKTAESTHANHKVRDANTYSQRSDAMSVTSSVIDPMLLEKAKNIIKDKPTADKGSMS